MQRRHAICSSSEHPPYFGVEAKRCILRCHVLPRRQTHLHGSEVVERLSEERIE